MHVTITEIYSCWAFLCKVNWSFKKQTDTLITCYFEVKGVTHYFRANRIFSVCSFSWVLFCNNVCLRLWHPGFQTDAETIRRERRVIFTITRESGAERVMHCVEPLLQWGRDPLSFKFHFPHIQRHIHLHHIMTQQIAPTPFVIRRDMNSRQCEMERCKLETGAKNIKAN